MAEEQTSYFKGLNRRDYIQKAHEIIEAEGMNGVSIRRLAKEMGCSSTSLYRYFSCRQELLYYAQLPSLRNYIKSLNRSEKKWENVWDIYVGVWYCYSTEAFLHPEAFNLLFFDNCQELDHAIKEYYSLFPEDIENTNEIFQEMLQTSDFDSRDMVICRKCIREKVITPENGRKLNRIACMMFGGHLKYILDHPKLDVKIADRVNDFIEDIDEIVRILASDLRGYRNYKQK